MYRIVTYQMVYRRFFCCRLRPPFFLDNLPNSLEDNAKYKKDMGDIYYITPSFPHNLPNYRFSNCNRSYFWPIYRIVTYQMVYRRFSWPITPSFLANLPNSLEDNAKYRKEMRAIY